MPEKEFLIHKILHITTNRIKRNVSLDRMKVRKMKKKKALDKKHVETWEAPIETTKTQTL